MMSLIEMDSSNIHQQKGQSPYAGHAGSSETIVPEPGEGQQLSDSQGGGPINQLVGEYTDTDMDIENIGDLPTD